MTEAVAAAPALEAEGISKRYGHVTALDGVTVALRRGEVLALVGDNGAGKSTLVSILSGLQQPDEGTISVGGERVKLASPHQAQELGISTVFQDLALVNQRDVAANLYLGQEPQRFGVVDRRAMLRGAAQVIADLRVNVPSVRAVVSDLSGGQRQAVAVARAVLQGGNVMLMDEPTAALGVREGGKVLELVARLRDDGYAVLLVSHNLETVFGLADRIVVLRLGRKLADVPVAQTTREEIVGLIVGVRDWGL